MKVNRGKQFEQAVKEAFLACPATSIDRLHDPMAGFAGVRNICDFVVYKYPFQYYFECKAISRNTLNFKSGISENQWQGLREKLETTKGVLPGIIVWFIDHDITAFISIKALISAKEQGAKSLNVKDILNNRIEHTIFKGKKKRVLFKYDAEDFLQQLSPQARETLF